ncbi:MAG TPA: hypothetical protein PLQ54_09950 [Armatimonadota bacterium]|nr:hypothetical protein [Armatimonadota bacterium]
MREDEMTFEKRLISSLVTLAIEAGLGQARLADALGWEVEKVWEFESAGGTRTVADVLSYARVVLTSA